MKDRRDGRPELARAVPANAGRRRRRLRRAVTLLLVLAAACVVVTVIAARRNRPDVRRPGEALADITDRLARNLPPQAPSPRFVDVTIDAGLGGFATFNGPRSSQLPEDMGPGAAWGDFDNDGDDDLFLVAAGGTLTSPPETWAPCALYENLADGTFREFEGFPPTRIMGMAASWADYDADGWLDLVVTGYGCLRLFRNDGERFSLDAALPDLEGYWAGATWGDFDNDRDLDLYVCGYVKYDADSAGPRTATRQYGNSVPYTLNPAAFAPERNLLFRNDGNRAFTEVAAEVGVANPEGRSLGAVWHDFDDDGWLDLYVANDISDNALYLNRDGSFEDASLSAHVADYRGAMGLAAGDWNRDGDDDLFVTHWIAQENALYDSLLQDLREATSGASDAPALQFTDVAARTGVGHIALHSVGWGTEFADFDGDGWLDLVVANGSTVETKDEPKRLKPEPLMLLWNRRGEAFHDLAPALPVLATPKVARGLALSDYDGDGDLDVAIMTLDAGVQILRNDMQTGHWLRLRLRSRVGPLEALHGRGVSSTVIVHQSDVALRRSVTSASYLSQSSGILHFGLGPAEAIDRVEVQWHGGGTQSFEGLQANALWELTEGQPRPRRVERISAAQGTMDRDRVVAFWAAQRGAMDAMKRDRDMPRAISLFREALALNPRHEDARYYLANCLAVEGEIDEALRHLEALREVDPSSHRASTRWGILRSMTAETGADLEAAAAALERSLEINREETGALHVLGEIALLQGEHALADQRFEWVCRTNSQAVGALFLRGYIAWRAGADDAEAYLHAARQARGEEWKPAGAVAEGDVASRMHEEVTPLSRYWEEWDGTPDPERAFASLRAFLDDDQRQR